MKLTPSDVRAWVKLAKTNEAMADALSKCMMIYALAHPDHITVEDEIKTTFKSQQQEEEQLAKLAGYRYGL